LTEAKPAYACGPYLLNPLWIQWKKAAHVRLAPTLLRLVNLCTSVGVQRVGQEFLLDMTTHS